MAATKSTPEVQASTPSTPSAPTPEGKPKTLKRVMNHPNQFMMVDGKLARIKKGTVVDVTEKQIERFGNKLTDVSGDSVDVSQGEGSGDS